MGIEDEDGLTAIHPGERLKAARERAGWSREQVALKLRLSVAQVTALENGEREGLPPAPYVRGYLRSYAQLLGLDPQEFAKTRVTSAPAPARDGDERAPRPVQVSSSLLYAVFVALAVALGLWWHRATRPRPRVSAPSVVSNPQARGILPPRLQSLAGGRRHGQLSEFPLTPQAAVVPPEALAHAPPPARKQQAGVASAPKAARIVGQRGAATQAAHPPANVHARPKVPAPRAVPNPGGLISLPGSHTVGLRVTATSRGVRVVVRDASGMRILARRIGAGHSVRVTGKPPFHVVLSRARGVAIRVAGHAVALPAVRAGRRLRLTVDR